MWRKLLKKCFIIAMFEKTFSFGSKKMGVNISVNAASSEMTKPPDSFPRWRPGDAFRIIRLDVPLR